jgi:hypothetical protein
MMMRVANAARGTLAQYRQRVGSRNAALKNSDGVSYTYPEKARQVATRSTNGVRGQADELAESAGPKTQRSYFFVMHILCIRLQINTVDSGRERL